MSATVTGLRAWLVQRFTAVILGAAFVWLGLRFLLGPPQSHAELRDWLAQPLVTLLLAGTFIAMLLHAWVGVRDVILDYVPPTGLRITLLALCASALCLMGLWVLAILLGGKP